MSPDTVASPADNRTGSVEKPCRVCQSSGPHALYSAREMMFGLRESFDYFECASCGCLQIREFLADVSPYYPKNYYAHTDSPDQQFERPMRAFLLRARVRYAVFGKGLIGRYAFNKKPEHGAQSLQFLNPPLTASILDVGCGTGLRLYALKEIGFQNLLGVDPHIDTDHTYKNGLRVEKKPLTDVSGQWDIIMFHHAFEHIDNPLETLQHVRRLLKPDGHCIIRVPTASSYAWRHYRTDWVQLDAPRHYFLHSRGSMDHLAENSGLRVKTVKFDSTEFQFVGSELYRRNISMQESATHPPICSDSEIREFQVRAEKLNDAGDGDSAVFYLSVAS